MRVVSIYPHLRLDEIRERMVSTKDRAQFQRWQVIYITALKNLEAEEVALFVGISPGTVHQWIHRYNHKGPEEFVIKNRGGRQRAILSVDEEKELLKAFEKDAKEGVIIVAKAIKEGVEGVLGRRVSDDYIYDLLHRHGWRKVAPHPRHPKSKPEVQEEFKKNFRKLWQPPAKPLARKMIAR